MSTTSLQPAKPFHVALQFGHIKHWNEGLAEVARQLGLQFGGQAANLKAEENWHFHFILPKQWHGMFGPDVTYHDLDEGMRWRHKFPVDLDVWHGLHQHMRYRPPVNSKRNIITVHDLNHVYAKKGLSLWWQNLRLTRQLRRAHQLVAISNFVANDIRKHLPWAPPVEVIYNGIPDLRLVESAKPENFSFSEGNYLLHISRMSPSKGTHHLINFANRYRQHDIALVGPSSKEVDNHQKKINDLRLTNIKIIRDATENEKAWLLKNCKAFLFPSQMEGFGLPALEALIFGKKCITTRNGAIPEICGPHAIYLSNLSESSLHSAVEEPLKTDPTELTKHALKFNWTTSSQSYINIYQTNAH